MCACIQTHVISSVTGDSEGNAYNGIVNYLMHQSCGTIYQTDKILMSWMMMMAVTPMMLKANPTKMAHFFPAVLCYPECGLSAGLSVVQVTASNILITVCIRPIFSHL